MIGSTLIGKQEQKFQMKKVSVVSCISLFIIAFMGFTAFGGETEKAVFVNQVRLTDQEIHDVEAFYHVRLKSGHFWYDTISGLWGIEGGPTMGQILPGLDLGGLLKADASKSNTGIFINGREIHDLELLFLQRVFGRTSQGRYWLNSRGIGGYEGGPAQFNLNMAAQKIGNEWIRRTPGGTIGGSGGCVYYNHPNGSSVMTGNCN